jgi:hypothetical protein
MSLKQHLLAESLIFYNQGVTDPFERKWVELVNQVFLKDNNSGLKRFKP